MSENNDKLVSYMSEQFIQMQELQKVLAECLIALERTAKFMTVKRLVPANYMIAAIEKAKGFVK